MAEGFGVLETGTTNKVTIHSVFHACSISKFFTAMLVLKLTEQGILDLDEDVNQRLTSWKVTDNEFTQNHKVTLRTLLSHQSGVMDPEGSFHELDSNQDIPTMVELLNGRTSYCKEPVQIKYPPNSDFHYSDAGFCIIQQLIEDASGKPFEVLMNELVFEPLQLKNSSIKQSIPTAARKELACGHHKNGQVVDERYPIYPYPAASGIWTTPTDLALLVIEVMNSLKKKSKMGLSERKINDLLTSQGCKITIANV